MPTSLRFLILFVLTSIPLVASAAFTPSDGVRQVNDGILNINSIISTFTGSVVKSLATLFATAAMVAFFYGIVEYIWGVRSAKPDQIATGNNFIKWSLVALFVMFSVWGIIIFFQRIFFSNQDISTITIPSIQIGGNSRSQPVPNPLGSPVPDTQSSVPVSNPVGSGVGQSVTNCAGQRLNTPCTVAGRVGACGNSDDGTWGCYVTPVSAGGGRTNTNTTTTNTASASSGCSPNGAECTLSDGSIGICTASVCMSYASSQAP